MIASTDVNDPVESPQSNSCWISGKPEAIQTGFGEISDFTRLIPPRKPDSFLLADHSGVGLFNHHKGVCRDLSKVANVRHCEICDLTFELTLSKLRRRTLRIPPFQQKCGPSPDQNECPNPIGVNAEQSLS